MISLRKSADRGFADHGWLKSFHSFSFAGYHDPRFMGFGNLRVINEDRIAPGTGFGTHGHRDMEIVSYVLAGNLAHKDTMGNVKGIPPGDVQRMSAGTGVQHSEFNHAKDQTTHFLQIWIEPSLRGIKPGYEQKTVDPQAKRGKLALIATPAEGASSVRGNAAGVGVGAGASGKVLDTQNAVLIHADASLYAGLFDGKETAELALDPARKAYVFLVRGELAVNGKKLSAGDAAGIEGESQLRLSDGRDAEVLVFDLAP